MSYDILVVAGTTEARDVIAGNLEKGRTVLACVATELGADVLCGYDVDVHIGRLDEEGFEKMRDFNRRIGLPVSFSEIGVTLEELDQVIPQMIADEDVQHFPYRLTREMIMNAARRLA